jgi:hypothetical protein
MLPELLSWLRRYSSSALDFQCLAPPDHQYYQNLTFCIEDVKSFGGQSSPQTAAKDSIFNLFNLQPTSTASSAVTVRTQGTKSHVGIGRLESSKVIGVIPPAKNTHLILLASSLRSSQHEEFDH